MIKSPFHQFKNTVLVFEVEDLSSDDVDSAGNPQPTRSLVTIEAFLEPVKSSRKTYTDYTNLSTSEEFLSGFVVNPFGKFPKGIAILSKTIKATYCDQEGIFTRTISLPSSVGTETVTGYPIAGIFKVL